MDDKQTNNAGHGLLAQLEILANGRTRVPCRDFEHMLNKEENASIPVSDLHKFLNFACDQLGVWQTDWLFSPVHFPNSVAKTEMEEWRILWQAFFNNLVEQFPDTRDLLERDNVLTYFNIH